MTKSSSRKRKPSRLTWKYTLNRGVSYHEISRKDYPWLWVAYKQGAFEELQVIKGLAAEEFSDYMDTVVENYYNRDGTIVVGEAYFAERDGQAPVCVTFVDKSQLAFFPHVIWFDWATPRNIIESTVNFLKDLVKDGNVVIFSEKENMFFFSHMARYGILDRRGTLKKYFPDGGDAIIYQGRK